MTDSVELKLRTDSEGFLSQECPSCETRFKVKLGEGSDQPIAFCPYCGHNGHDCWWTPEQAEYISATVGEEMVGPMLDEAARDFNRRARSPRGPISMSMEVSHGKPPRQPPEPEENWPRTKFECCNETIRHQERETLHCIICGSTGKGVEV